MTDYYVRDDGDDANNGLSDGNAWRTVGKVYTEFYNSTFNRGDNIYFKADDTFPITAWGNELRIRNIGGSSGYLTIGKYGSGADPIFDCNGQAVPAVYIHESYSNIDYFIIQDIEFYDAGEALIYIRGATNFTLQRLTIHETTAGGGSSPGIYILKDAQTFTINDCEIYDTNGECIYLGTWNDDTDRTGYCSIYDNNLHDCGAEGIDCKAGTRNVKVMYNTLTNCNDNTAWGSAIRLGGQGHRVSQNTITDTGNASASSKDAITIYYGNGAEDPSDIVVEDNVIDTVLATTGYGLRAQYCNTIKFWRNTVIDCTYGMHLETNTTSVVSRNNKFDSCTVGLVVKSGVSLPDSNYNYFVGCNNDTNLEGRGGLQTISSACTNYSIECNSRLTYPTEVDVYDDDANLQGYWLLDEASGTRADSSDNGNTLADNNTVGYENNARIGEAADFELDQSEYLSIADGSQTGLDITNSMTLLAQVVPETIGSLMVIAGKYNTGTADRSYQLRIGTDGSLQALISDDGTSYAHAYTQANTLGTDIGYWVGFVYDGTDIRLYVNGHLLGANNNPETYSSGVNDSAAPFQIGAREGATNLYDGLANKVQVFDRALSEGEMLSIAENGLQAGTAIGVIVVVVVITVVVVAMQEA